MTRIACLVPVGADYMPYKTVASMLAMRIPPNVEMGWIFSKYSPVDRNRNLLVDGAIESKADIVMCLDSDQVFPVDTIVKLYDWIKKGKKIVGGLYFQKNPPFLPLVYHLGKDGHKGNNILDYPDKIFKVDVLATGCLMVDVEVFKKIGYPFFKKENVWDSRGELPHTGDDWSFCLKAKKHGYQVWCDPTIKCGHLTTVETEEDNFQSLLKNNLI